MEWERVINPRRACAEGLWCVSVCYYSGGNIARFCALNKVHRGLS